MNPKRFSACFAFVAAGWLLASFAHAQDLPNMVDVAIVHVDIGMTDAFEAVQRDRVAKMKEEKAKRPRTIYSTVRGKTSEYRIVTPMDNYAYLDDPDQVGDAAWNANWVAQVTKFIHTREMVIAQVMKDHSNPSPETSPLASLITFTIREGKLSEFDQLVKDEWIPLRKKLGIPGPVVYRVRFGERSRRERVFAFPRENWANTDRPNQFLAKGGEQAQAIIDRIGPLIADSRSIVIRHRPDLSYAPE